MTRADALAKADELLQGLLASGDDKVFESVSRRGNVGTAEDRRQDHGRGDVVLLSTYL